MKIMLSQFYDFFGIPRTVFTDYLFGIYGILVSSSVLTGACTLMAFWLFLVF